MEILSRLKSTYTNENGENVFLFCSFMSLTSQNLLSKGFSAAEKKTTTVKCCYCVLCVVNTKLRAERCMKRSNVTNSCINVCFHSKSGDLLALSISFSLSLSLSSMCQKWKSSVCMVLSPEFTNVFHSFPIHQIYGPSIRFLASMQLVSVLLYR